MTCSFGEFELDPDRRELRRRGRPLSLQPQVLALLLYLAERRERAVGKEELLEALCPGVAVTTGSLQRAVSLARASLGPEGREWIRTLPRFGYRFAAPVTAAGTDGPRLRPRYVRRGAVHVAYHVLGTGPPDILVVLGWAFPMAAALELPEMERQCRALARLGRLVLFDKRGTGMSDRVERLPGLEERMEDVEGVLDAVGSERALLVGVSEGGPLCLMLAASRPRRVRGLLLAGAFARMAAAPDYPWGWTPDAVERLRGYVRSSWGAGATFTAAAPSRREDPAFRAWAQRAELLGASPGAALALVDMNLAIDARALLPAVRVPTTILHRAGDPVVHPGHGRFLADSIPGARHVERPGADHLFCFDDPDPLVEEAGRLLATPAGELS